MCDPCRHRGVELAQCVMALAGVDALVAAARLDEVQRARQRHQSAGVGVEAMSLRRIDQGDSPRDLDEDAIAVGHAEAMRLLGRSDGGEPRPGGAAAAG